MDFREKRTYDIFPMRFYDSVRRIFIFLKSLSLRDRRGRQKRVMVNASRRFSINRNAIADILFQGLNDLHFPSLSISRLDRRDYIWRNETIIGPRIRRVDRSSIGLYIYMYREKTKKKKKKRHTARARRRDFPGIIERFVPQLRINYGEMMDGTKSRWLLPIYPPVIRSRLVWRRLHRRGAEMSLRNLLERTQPTRSSSPNYGLLPSHRGAPS